MRYAKSIFTVMVLVAAAATVGIAILGPANPKWVYGFALGAAGQLLKFRVIDVPTVIRIGTAPENAVKTQLLSTFMGFAILGSVFLIAILWRGSMFQPWMTLGGVLLPRLVLVADGYFRPNLFAEPGPDKPDPAATGEKQNGNPK